MDKSFVNQLVDRLERLTIENLALRQYVNAVHRLVESQRKQQPSIPRTPPAHDLIEAKLRSPETLSLVREMYAPLRSRIEQGESLESVIQELLRIAPANKDVN